MCARPNSRSHGNSRTGSSNFAHSAARSGRDADRPCSPLPSSVGGQRSNRGWQNAGSAPWHLKATYELLDDKGAVRETGTFEEFLISGKKNKLIYSSPSFNQTDYSNDQGAYRVGDPAWPDEAVAVVQQSFFPLFPSAKVMAKQEFKVKDRSVGGLILKCAQNESSHSLAPVAPPSFLFCFDTDIPALRVALASSGLYEIVYNHISLFRGTYVAREAQVTRLGKPIVHIRLDSLDSDGPNAAIPGAAPSTALSINRRSPLECDAGGGKSIEKVAPRYPSDAKSARIQGIVLCFRAIIEPLDGKGLRGPPSCRRQDLGRGIFGSGPQMDLQTM